MASLIHRDTSTGNSTSTIVVTSGAITLSSKIVAGDLLVAKVFFAANAGSVTAPSAPAGWTSPASNSSIQSIASLGSGSNNIGVIVFTKTAVLADASGTFTVDFTGKNVYNWAIEVDATYATDGVTPTIDGTFAFSYVDQATQLTCTAPTLSQNGDFVYCSVGTYQGNLAVFEFGQWDWKGNNGFGNIANQVHSGLIPIVGYDAFDLNNKLGGLGGQTNQMGLEGAYFGWHSTSGLQPIIMFAGTTTSMIAVTYGVKALNPGVVFMGIWTLAGGPGGNNTSLLSGYFGGNSATNAVLIAQFTQSSSGGSPVGQVVTPPAGWTRIGTQLVDTTSTVSQDMFWHVVAAGGTDPNTWTFTVPIATRLSLEIITVGLVDTTTPVEVVAGTTQPSVNVGKVGAGAIVAPSITPRGTDEMLVWFWASRNYTSFGGTPLSLSSGPSKTYRVPLNSSIFNGVAAIGYGGVENCAAQYCYNDNSFVQGPSGAAHTIALKASGTIVRPAANVRIDQMAIIAIGLGGAPIPAPPSGGLYAINVIPGSIPLENYKHPVVRQVSAIGAQALYFEPETSKVLAGWNSGIYHLEESGIVVDDGTGTLPFSLRPISIYTGDKYTGKGLRILLDINPGGNTFSVYASVDGVDYLLSAALTGTSRTKYEFPFNITGSVIGAYITTTGGAGVIEVHRIAIEADISGLDDQGSQGGPQTAALRPLYGGQPPVPSGGKS